MKSEREVVREVIVDAEIFRQMRHYTDCYLSKWPSCGAPTEAEIDSASRLSASVPGEAVAWQTFDGYSDEWVYCSRQSYESGIKQRPDAYRALHLGGKP